jgi:AraC-like DNA-binding protein
MRMREDIISFINEAAETEAPFFIEMTGISYCDDTYRIARKNCPFYVFEYILEGEGTVIVDGKTFTAKKGDVYILHRNSNHRYFSDRTNPWTKIWFNAKGSLIDSLIQIYKLGTINHIEGTEVSSLFYQILSKAKRAKNSNANFLEEASLLFYKMILTLYPCVHKTDPAYSLEAGILKEYLDKNNMNKVVLKDLCDQIYHSPSQTIRIFKKAYGITPYQYLMNQKLELAKLILLNTNKSIKEISMELNFYDEHYFSNFFKEKIGISPLNYRKTNQ